MSYLVLERKPGQKILIGDDYEVRLVSLSPKRAVIGITAPDNVAVDREEVRRAKNRDKE